MHIHRSARKHGVTDEDILHAAARAVRRLDLDDERTLLIGADTAGRLLELIVPTTATRTRS